MDRAFDLFLVAGQAGLGMGIAGRPQFGQQVAIGRNDLFCLVQSLFVILFQTATPAVFFSIITASRPGWKVVKSGWFDKRGLRTISSYPYKEHAWRISGR
jgi:hypothetical protein